MKKKYILLAVGIAYFYPVDAQNNIVTQRGNNQRTGAYTNEKTLTTTNVNVKGFGKLYSYPVDGQVYAQPLYVQGVNVAGKGKRNVLFIATEHNTIYAYDADSLTAPLWQISTGPECIFPDPHFDSYGVYHDIKIEVGITSTPVIDTLTNTLYAVAFNRLNGVYSHQLYAIDITSGSLKMNSPKALSATIAGTGVQDINGLVTFDSKQELQRSALVLSNGVIYVVFASYGDRNPYHGWVLGYNATDLTQKYVFNTTPNGQQAGIWMGGQGLSVDSNGDLYLSTGNGDFNANTGGTEYGDSFIKLHPSATALTVADYFTPFNQANLNATDADLGCDAPIIIPNSNLIAGSCKRGIVYVMDRSNMGKFNTSDQVIQNFHALSGYNHGSLAYWEGNTGAYLYGWSQYDHLKAFKRNGNVFVTTPSSQSIVKSPGPDMPGGILSISSNGTNAGTGIVWANIPLTGDSNLVRVQGVLRAFDANDLTKELWNSNQNSNRDGSGTFAKFNSPVIVKGKVYQASFSKQVVVYGLNPTDVYQVAVNPTNVVNGLNYNYYENTFANLSTISSLTPVKTNNITNFMLSPATVSKNYGFSYVGYIDIAVDGLYDFYLNSADGSNLFIGNSIIIDNDGTHSAQEVHGSIDLKAGKHSITVNYYQLTGLATLDVSYSLAGQSKVPVPDAMLYSDGAVINSLNSVSQNNTGTFLHQNIPNPVTQTTKIEFGVNTPGKVEITLFRIDGTEVKTLFQGRVADRASIDFNVDRLPGGMYFYKMVTESGTLAKSLLIIK